MSNLLLNSRIKNQADLYAIYGAFSSVLDSKIDIELTALQISEFYELVDLEKFENNPKVEEYYYTIRSNVNQGTVRQQRINLILEHFVIED